jgi:hypothetical protein
MGLEPCMANVHRPILDACAHLLAVCSCNVAEGEVLNVCCCDVGSGTPLLGRSSSARSCLRLEDLPGIGQVITR